VVLARDADGDSAGAGLGDELVLVALPGVQQFIEETRSVSDARAASEVYSRLSAEIVAECERPGIRLIFPSGSAESSGLPNRVVALCSPGVWPAVAAEVRARVESTWQGWVRQALKLRAGPVPETPVTPGMPQVQWVCVPSLPGGYPEQWESAQRLMAGRRQVRDFPAVQWRQRDLCSVGPRWPAEPMPAGLKEHQKTLLSAAGWVKRQWRAIHGLEGFPSTASIASAPFRLAVLEHLAEPDVRDAAGELTRVAREVIRITQGGDVTESRVPGLPDLGDQPGRWFASTGGPWVYPDRWQAESLAREAEADLSVLRPLAERGLKAARHLVEVMGRLEVPPPASYLAVVAQDLDNMGRFLSGHAESADRHRIEVTPAGHGQVSAALQDTGIVQRRRLEDREVLGLPAYTGGDDLLAFVPAVHALAAAQSCHDAVPPSLPTASTAICFFHYHASLRDALVSVRQQLAVAKELDGKHGLSVGYLRRSGVSEASVQPWRSGGADTARAFGVFARSSRYRLSPGLVTDLERDSRELARLSSLHPVAYRAELARLIRRHLDGDPPAAEVTEVVAAITRLGGQEASKRPDQVPAADAWPLPAARVAVFLRQEAR
jgi:hypothetical protein